MLTDLKPCPFCGGKAHESNGWVSCAYGCASLSIDDWNRRAIEAEVRAEAKGPVTNANDTAKLRFFRDMTSAERRKVFEVFGIESAVLNEVRSLSDETRLFNHLFTAPQPPAPCPRCEYHIKEHEAVYALLSRKTAEADALQAKVSEQSEEIAQLIKVRDEYLYAAAGHLNVRAQQVELITELDKTIAKQYARITELEAERQEFLATIDKIGAAIGYDFSGGLAELAVSRLTTQDARIAELEQRGERK